MRILTGILVVSVVLLIAACGSGIEDQSIRDGKVIKAANIVAEFENNAVMASTKYEGQTFSVVGVPSTIDYDYYNNPYITLENDVKCILSDASETSNLSVGEEVTVKGTFSKWDIWIYINPCSVVNAPTVSPAATAIDDAKNGKEATVHNSSPSMSIDKTKGYSARIEVEEFGEIVVELYPKEAPVTVNNFVFLAREGYYDNLTFHRVIADFMAQTGDPTGTGAGGPGYKFDNELSPDRRHDAPGVLSMANSGTRDGKGTNGSQFFITFRATPWLDGYNVDGTPKDCNSESCHTVFGKVTAGLSTVLNLPIRDPGTATEPGARILKITIDESD